METGNTIKENVVVSRVAEGAIVFLAGAKYAPVIEGTAANQVKPATAAATNVVGFVKKPTTKDAIADKDAVDVVIDGVIRMYAAAAVAQNDMMVVDATVTQLVTLIPDITTVTTLRDSLKKKVATAKSSAAAAGWVYVQIGTGW